MLGAFLFFSSAFLGTCEVLVRVGRRRKSNVSALIVSVFLHTEHMFCVAVRFACWSFVWVMGLFHEDQLKQSSSCSLFGAIVDLLIFASCIERDGVCSAVRVRICCLRGESVPFWMPRAELVTWFVCAKVLVCRVLRESDGLDSCWFCLSSCV